MLYPCGGFGNVRFSASVAKIDKDCFRIWGVINFDDGIKMLQEAGEDLSKL